MAGEMQDDDESMRGQHSPASANSPSGPSSGPKADNYRIIRKRNRIPLSCGPCRSRKLKCNRQSPCDNCIKRGDGAACAYAAPTTKRKGTASSTSPTSGGGSDDMQNRIDRLEGLVLSLMTNGTSTNGAAAAHAAIRSATSSTIGSGSLGPSLDSQLDDSVMNDQSYVDAAENESETDGVIKSLGVLKVDQERNKTFYIGEAHWAALLNELSEVKNYFSSHKKEYEAQAEKIAQTRKSAGVEAGSGSTLLFGAGKPPPREDIIRALPSRYLSDMLVTRYFNNYDPATHILHGATFQKQYRAHWQDPSKTSIVWVGMLFAIMRLAMLSFAIEGDEPPEFRGKCQDMASTYRSQMANCLILADYTKPHAFCLETLIIHLHGEHRTNRDADASDWILIGVIVRLAMRMGYHRDSKFFPDLTPYQGEMRRRVWAFVRTADLLFSFQAALPPMIRLGDSDTDLPRNIYDDEFDETSTQLPPPRPPSEATPISYLVAKSKLALGFGRVLEEINGIQRKSYDEVLKIDKALRDIYDSIPDHLKVRPMSEQAMAPQALVDARLGLATIYHKALCTLHRRYVRLAKQGSRYMYSRKTCLESSLQILEYQRIQQQWEQNRGNMSQKPAARRHVSSLVAHDYLLAGTLVCMDLYQDREAAQMDGSNGGSTPNTNSSAATPASSVSGGRGSVGSPDGSGIYMPGLSYTRDEVLSALEHSRDIWMQQRDVSMEAFKASELLNVLLYQFKPHSSSSPPPISNLNAQRDNPTQGNNDEQTAAMTLGMLQAGGNNGTSGMHQQQAMQAAQIAQQTQMQLPQPGGGNSSNNSMAWEKNNSNSNVSNMDAFLSGSSMGMNNGISMNTGGNMFGTSTIPDPNDWGSVFGAGNGMFPQTIFGTNTSSSGPSGINIDWEAWDQYMQPSNVSLDPMASLWPSGGSPNANGYFPNTQSSSMSPPDLPNNAQGSKIEGGFGAGDGGYINGTSSQGNTEGSSGEQGSAGDTFMGASTPGWKWGVETNR